MCKYAVMQLIHVFFFFFSSRRRHTSWTGDWSSDVCSSDLHAQMPREIILGVRGHEIVAAGRLHMQSRAVPLDMHGARAQWPRKSKRSSSPRSEERRVGKEGRSGLARVHIEYVDICMCDD